MFRALLIISCFCLLLAVCVLIAANFNSNPLPPNAVADRVLVEKAARRLTLFRENKPVKTYRVALGHSPVGPKEKEGDQRTPEGNYLIDFHKEDSDFHRALHVSYPGPHDIDQATARGVSAGGDIMIHGIRNGIGWIGALHRRTDWTAGCVAVTNFEIEEIWRAVPDGTSIEIRP
jgi:murein L,D-transpeptidase YafK